MAQKLSAAFGQSVIVDNRAGAATTVASNYTAKAAPDGYTIYAGGTSLVINPTLQGNVQYDPHKSFELVSLMSLTPFILQVNADFPAKNMAELLAYLQAGASRVNVASPGSGSMSNMAAELFRARTGLKYTLVPYRGGAQGGQDVAAGNVQMMFGNLPEFLGQLSAGNLIPIAFGGASRAPAFPNVPLMSQYLPGYRVDNWFAVFGPRNLPAELVDLWNKVLRTALAKPEIQKRYAENAMEIVTGSPAELKATIASDRKKWQEIIQAVGMKNE